MHFSYTHYNMYGSLLLLSKRYIAAFCSNSMFEYNGGSMISYNSSTPESIRDKLLRTWVVVLGIVLVVWVMTIEVACKWYMFLGCILQMPEGVCWPSRDLRARQFEATLQSKASCHVANQQKACFNMTPGYLSISVSSAVCDQSRKIKKNRIFYVARLASATI